MFRKEMVDKYGWDVTKVEKLEDLEPMLEEAKEGDDLQYPFLLQSTAMFYRLMMDRFDFFTGKVETNFFAVDRKTGEVVNTLQTPEYAAYCKLMGEWADKEYISGDESLMMLRRRAYSPCHSDAIHRSSSRQPSQELRKRKPCHGNDTGRA